ncbi:MAG: A/G-specific adenine glycosylase [Fibrobacterota bacterium]|nr:A/G-specific adenine glycosylase [Fibrobacterota bacterium]QQS06088.1 MAG: A/G-specific adenine glycosylase [Fibrobacterota bacterium]
MKFTSLLPWFSAHRRSLPWRTARGTPRDPWQTLISEVMSQQTRLEVVEPRYVEWMERFPTPQHLARASQEEVLAAWAGLGYYSRARNLHKAAQSIARDGWPATFEGLLALPGLGPYTAAAIGSLSMGLQVPMVDGNVQRVLSRFHALALDPRSGPGAKRLREMAIDWIQGAEAGEMNEASMELGALVCKPRNPSCGECPLAEGCRACAMGTPEAFPPAKARKEVVPIRRKVVVVERSGGILLRRAQESELLTGLWILPAEGDSPALVADEPCLGLVRHSITHHQVVWEVAKGAWSGGTLPSGWQWHGRSELPAVVVSSLLRKALEIASILPVAQGNSRKAR